MNKIYKISLYLALLFLVVNCNNTKKEIDVNLSDTDYNVIIRVPKDNKKRVLRIQFPRNILVKNNSFFKKSFISVDYHYNDSLARWRNHGIGLYKNDGQELKRISNNKSRTIHVKGSLEYIYYTRHFLDSSKTTQQQFKPYIEEMLAQNKDTLHIGTIKSFKKKHKKLYERLTGNDSISIRFLKDRKFGKRIIVPVN